MAAGRIYEFGDFRLDPSERLLFCSNKHVPLPPKTVDMLVLLVERRGHLVDKDTLLKELWPDTFVEEGSLAQNISVLRKILTEGRDGKDLIETIPKRGYRFVAEVREVVASPAPDEGEVGGLLRWRSRKVAIALISVALVMAAGYVGVRRYWPGAARASPHVMLAVLPVQNLTGDASREYLSDGLTEELIAQLGGFNPQQLGVIARTSSMAFKDSHATVAEIGRALGVDYVVEASLRGSGEHLRVTAQLIRTRDQTHLWAEDYDRNMRDIVGLEDEVSQAIAREIQLKLTPAAQARTARKLAIREESYQSYLEGRYYWNRRSKEGLEKGLDYFDKAAQQDPANARAYAGTADAYNLLHFYGYSPGAGTILLAKQAADKSQQIDDSLAEGHAALAYINFMWLWEWPTADREFRRAIELNANYVSAHHWYALFLSTMGRHPEAIEEIKVAQKLDPLSPIINTAAGLVFHYARQDDAAIRECKAVLARNPSFGVAHDVLGWAYEAKGMSAEAIAEFQETIRLMGPQGTYLGDLGHAYAVVGRKADAERVLVELDERARSEGFLGQSSKAIIYVGLGEKEKAFDALEKGHKQNDPMMIWIRVQPEFDAVRSDSRFQEILRQQGSPP